MRGRMLAKIAAPAANGLWGESAKGDYMGTTPILSLLVLIILATLLLLPLIALIVIQSRKYMCFRHELEFKREMVERGLSIDEIERVISAKSPSGRQK